MSKGPFIPLEFEPYAPDVMRSRALEYYREVRTRRTVRDFSPEPVARDVIEHALLTAGSAPSGANMQPWHFVAISDPRVKRSIREAAEREEQAFYAHRASEEWLKAIEPLGTDAEKPFLEIAPWLIAVFLKKFTFDADGTRHKNYYTSESVGIACGFLLAALHHAGLATLTHTPSPMKFLGEVLERPVTERAYMLIVAGLPAEGASVPAISKQPLDQIATFKTGD